MANDQPCFVVKFSGGRRVNVREEIFLVVCGWVRVSGRCVWALAGQYLEKLNQGSGAKGAFFRVGAVCESTKTSKV